MDYATAFADVDHLLSTHTKRNPRLGELSVLANRISECLNEQPNPAALIYLARISLANGDLSSAVEHLLAADSEVAEIQEQRMLLAEHIALLMGGPRNAKSPKMPSDVGLTFDKLCKVAAERASLKRRIEMLSCVARNKRIAGLEIAVERLLEEHGSIADINHILKLVYKRSYSSTSHKAVLKLINDGVTSDKVKSELLETVWLLDINARARHAAGGGAERPDILEVQQYLDRNGLRGARRLASSKDIYLYMYEGDEAIKELISRYLEEGLINHPSGSLAKRYIESWARTKLFWQSVDEQTRIIAIAEHACEQDDSGESLFVKGIGGFLRNDMKGAQQFFSLTTSKSVQLAQTGATSFFCDLTQEDEESFKECFTDYSEVRYTRYAYVCCADERFFKRHARPYADSARKFSKDIRLHFHIASSDKETAFRLFKDTVGDHENVSFSWERPTVPIPTYYASMRFLRIADFLERVAENIILTDIDVDFNNCPTTFIRNSRLSDVDAAFRIYDSVRSVGAHKSRGGKIYRDPRLLPWSVVNAACFAVAATPLGMQIANIVARDMRRHLGRALSVRDSAWWIDQNSLLLSLRESLKIEGVKILNLEDVGIPYGSFDYSSVRTWQSVHPAIGTFLSRS